MISTANAGLTLYTGVVEDRKDPLQLGRCRVRVVGPHTKDTTVLPTPDLPWAVPMSGITSASLSGIGDAPVGPVEGTWVVIFFIDGDECQQPCILGTLNGIPQSAYFNSLKPTDGFRDPSKHYPLATLMDEPTTNRLARGISEGTIVDLKNSTLETGIEVADGTAWDQPSSAFNASYPYNHVYQSESGHIVEKDDTPNFERTHDYHRSGTFTEIDSNGTAVRRIVGDSYEILDRNGFIYIKGAASLTVEGDVNIYVKNDCNLRVDGDLNTEVHGDYEINVAGKLDITTGEAISINSKLAVGILAPVLYFEATTIGAIKAPTFGLDIPVMPQMGLTINPFLPPIYAPAAKIATNLPFIADPVDLLSPSEPTLPQLGFTLSAVQQASFAAEQATAFAQANDPLSSTAIKDVSQEYVNLKTDELTTNQQVSAPAKMVTNTDTSCPVGLRAAAATTKYIGVLETGTLPGLNYGGKLGGGQLPLGVPGIIDTMLKKCGIDNQALVQRTGQGASWCGAFCATIWQEAGLPIPSGAASCKNWEAWAKANGYFSQTPKIGSVILYGPSGAAYHCGIVVAIGADGSISSVEGNTTGSGFTTNGCTVAIKTPRTFLGFVIPPSCI